MESKEQLKKIENMMYFDPADTHKWHPYRDSEDYITYHDDEEGVIKVTKKFSEEDWAEMDDFFDSHPLFNNDLSADDLETNEYLQELQSIKYSEGADVIMEKLYNEGNKYMKEKLINLKKGEERPIYFIKKAMDAYCDALNQECQMPELRKKILSNRALINLWLKNYGKVVEDCLNSISIDKEFISPYVRATEALVGLGKWEKAIKMADKGMLQLEVNFKKENIKNEKSFSKKSGKYPIFEDLKKEAQIGLKKQKQKEELKAKKEAAKNTRVALSCSEKGVVLGEMSSFPLPDIYSRELKVQNGMLITPILFIYPEFGQFDYAGDSSEDFKIWDIFEQIIAEGLPWDVNGFYKNINSLEYYVMKNGSKPITDLPEKWDKKEGIIKVDKNETILEVMKKEGHILPGILEITVVSKNSGFYETFLNQF